MLEWRRRWRRVFQASDPRSPLLPDAASGLITTRGKLDRETKSQHSVVVIAKDLGRPPQIASRVLLINVTDADDNDPVFVKLSVKRKATTPKARSRPCLNGS